MSPTVVTDGAIGVLLGGALGAGICLVLWAVPRWGAMTLDRRIAPYLRDIADPRGLTPLAGPVRSGPALARLTAALAGVIGGKDALTLRLRRAGSPMDPTVYRMRQLAWAGAGFVAGAAVSVVLVVAGAAAPAAFLLPAVGAVAAWMLVAWRLSVAVRARAQRVAEELPAILEFLALCLAAGEGMLDAFRRVTVVGDGELVRMLRAVLVEVGTGSGIADALRGMARDAQLPPLTRSVDQIVAAIERGAPLAHVLQAQAVDAQEDAKRSLIEMAGKKEIAMLFPLVFLILPLSVLIAVFPGVMMLRLGF